MKTPCRDFPPLYLIADLSLYLGKSAEDLTGESAFFHAVKEAISGGIELIQYRDKSSTRSVRFQRAKKLRELTLQRGVILILNDDIDLAMAVKSDGIHLGQDDFPVEMARKLLGKRAIIGLSTHNLDQAIEAASKDIDYIGFGPLFHTKTKSTQIQPVGTSAITMIRKKVSLPLYTIGGIQFSHLPMIMSSGATGVALASALVKAKREEVAQWCMALNAYQSEGNQKSRILKK